MIDLIGSILLPDFLGLILVAWNIKYFHCDVEETSDILSEENAASNVSVAAKN